MKKLFGLFVLGLLAFAPVSATATEIPVIALSSAAGTYDISDQITPSLNYYTSTTVKKGDTFNVVVAAHTTITLTIAVTSTGVSTSGDYGISTSNSSSYGGIYTDFYVQNGVVTTTAPSSGTAYHYILHAGAWDNPNSHTEASGTIQTISNGQVVDKSQTNYTMSEGSYTGTNTATALLTAYAYMINRQTGTITIENLTDNAVTVPVDFYTVVEGYTGETITYTVTPNAPLPAALPLFGLALAGLGFKRRKK